MGNPFTSQPNNQQLLQFKTNQFQQRDLLFSSSSCWPFTKPLPVPKGSASLSTPLISLAHLEVLLDSVMVTLIFLELRAPGSASPILKTEDFLLEMDKVSVQATYSEVSKPVEMAKVNLSENKCFSSSCVS